jgi:phosphoserine phosphatase
MTQNSAQSEQFTGLILLTGSDKSGIAASLFDTLAPFAVNIIDIEQVLINNRLILTVLIGANPAHQGAIEEDLNSCALALDVDIATLFTKGQLSTLPDNLVAIQITASKLHPRSVALISKALADAGANIERFVRTSAEPVSITATVSGADKKSVEAAITNLTFEDPTSIAVKDL